MSRLIGDLLDVVSIDIGKFTVCRTIEEIVESFVPIASPKGIALTVKLVEDSMPARFDHQERKGEDVWFVVTDSGPGIAADRLPTIFESFRQAAVPTERD